MQLHVKWSQYYVLFQYGCSLCINVTWWGSLICYSVDGIWGSLIIYAKNVYFEISQSRQSTQLQSADIQPVSEYLFPVFVVPENHQAKTWTSWCENQQPDSMHGNFMLLMLSQTLITTATKKCSSSNHQVLLNMTVCL